MLVAPAPAPARNPVRRREVATSVRDGPNKEPNVTSGEFVRGVHDSNGDSYGFGVLYQVSLFYPTLDIPAHRAPDLFVTARGQDARKTYQTSMSRGEDGDIEPLTKVYDGRYEPPTHPFRSPCPLVSYG